MKTTIHTVTTLLLFLSSFSISFSQDANWFPVRTIIESSWARKIDPDNLLNVYPRPTLKRDDWINLNGLWKFGTTNKDAERPGAYQRHILVPFAPESNLSGVGIKIDPDDKIWYNREFIIPEDWSGKFIKLHFGASDYETTVFVNGKKVGMHRGGYDPFSFDITYFLNEKGKQTVEVCVWDPTEHHFQSRGKQTTNPEGIWYTAVSGIWQTVWIEPVESTHIVQLKTETDIDASNVTFTLSAVNVNPADSFMVSISENKRLRFTGQFSQGVPVKINITEPKLWSPESPFLYEASIELVRNGKVLDKAMTYFGMRKISLNKDRDGITRIFLNNRPYFLLGVLDQGWWPGGLYTAPSISAMEYDIDQVKSMGFNTIRKHVKVEPATWYHHCDKIGMLVWQDMPNGDENADWKGPAGIDGVEIKRAFPSEAQYKIEFEAIIKALQNHPSIVYWCPFNEGWGQFKTVEITNWVKELDNSRLVGGPSGGNYFPVGDTRDHHQYPGPGLPPMDAGRAMVLSEFGGLGYVEKSHLWNPNAQWSYQPFQKKKDLEDAYIALMQSIIPLQKKGLCAAIYTQLTDVETEINGILTYDRAVMKLNPKKIEKIHMDIRNAYLDE